MCIMSGGRSIAGAIVLILALLLAGAAHAERRVALVIGNQDYAHLPHLEKSDADAKTYADLFKAKGFDNVIFYTDLTRLGMDEAIAEFADAIQPGDVAVFVYAGHGWSDGTQNYLVGTDAPQIGSEDFLKRISVPIENGATGVLDTMQSKDAALKVAIIDACRDNPFKASDNTRSIGMSRGLDRMTAAPQGTFVVYSAGAGQSALDQLSDDDSNPNGVFTRTFVPLLKSNLTLLDATKAAQETVYEMARAVGHDQQPAYYDETRGDRACLSDTCASAEGLGSAAKANDESVFWQSIANSANPADFQAYLKTFPNGVFGSLARSRLAALEPTTPPVAPSPPNAAPITLVGHTDSVEDAEFSPDGKRIVTASQDGTVKIWDAASGQLLDTLEIPSDGVLGVQLLAGGARVLLSAPPPGPYDPQVSMQIRDLTSNRLIVKMPRVAALSPLGDRVVTIGDDYHDRGALWDAVSGRLITDLDDFVNSATFSPDGSRFVTTDAGGTAVWDAASGRLLRSINEPDDWFAAFSPDGRRIVVGNSNNTAKVFDTSTWRPLLTLKGHSGAVKFAAFSPQGDRILTTSEDNTTRVWDAISGHLIDTLRDLGDEVLSACFSPDGSRVITSNSSNGRAVGSEIWDVYSGHLIKRVHFVDCWNAFSPDGRSVIATDQSDDNTGYIAEIFDARTGRTLAVLKGHTGYIYSASFSPDGSRIVTASSDGTAKIWNVAAAIAQAAFQFPPSSRHDLDAGGTETDGSAPIIINVPDALINKKRPTW